MSSNLLGVVLCGGQSSRMGQEKSQLEHPQGGTFLQLALKRLKDICHDVIIAGTPPGTEPGADTGAANSESPALEDPVPLSRSHRRHCPICEVCQTQIHEGLFGHTDRHAKLDHR